MTTAQRPPEAPPANVNRRLCHTVAALHPFQRSLAIFLHNYHLSDVTALDQVCVVVRLPRLNHARQVLHKCKEALALPSKSSSRRLVEAEAGIKPPLVDRSFERFLGLDRKDLRQP
jgi:hypothetical protein